MDAQTWKLRLTRFNKNWEPRLQELTDSYIQWKYSEKPTITTYNDATVSPALDGYDFDIDVLDIHKLSRVAVIPCNEQTHASTALVLAGFLGTSPEHPSLAIALPTLELFYTIRLFRPSFSVEAFAKVICHTLSVSYFS